MYHISVIKSGELSLYQQVITCAEIRQVLEIGDDEAIEFSNGMFTREVSEDEHWNVLQASNLFSVIMEDKTILAVNVSSTHVMYKGEFYEIYEDQSGDHYIHADGGTVYITACTGRDDLAILDREFTCDGEVLDLEEFMSVNEAETIAPVLRMRKGDTVIIGGGAFAEFHIGRVK